MERRTVLEAIGAGGIGMLANTVAAKPGGKENPKNTRQVTAQSETSEESSVVTKKQEVTAKDARQYVSNIPNNLADSLKRDNLVEHSQNNIGYHQMSDGRLRGGIENIK
ncbi:hypothetical protein [Halorhabdus amylolytica]|uniref:hypothetical protein n=1 Tax=Halorhabdus amylolytica TaxID=2559573 RepID=UPI0010AA1C1D|nr:hypothetical protein [Halorhabdus amylolytica]